MKIMNMENLKLIGEIVGALTGIGGIIILIHKLGRFTENVYKFQIDTNKFQQETKDDLKEIKAELKELNKRITTVETQEDYSRSIILEMVKKK